MNIPTNGRPMRMAQRELEALRQRQELSQYDAVQQQAEFEDQLERSKGEVPEAILALFRHMGRLAQPRHQVLPTAEEFERQAVEQAMYKYAPMFLEDLIDGSIRILDFESLVQDARAIIFHPDASGPRAILEFAPDQEPLVLTGPAASYLKRYLHCLGIFQAILARKQCPDCKGLQDDCQACGGLGWVADPALKTA